MNIVVVFPKKEIVKKINSILVKNGFDVVADCITGAQALQAAERLEEGIIVSGIRYVDMMYYDLKDNLSESFEMIVLASSGQWEQYGNDDVIWMSMPMKAYDLVELVSDVAYELEKKMKAIQSKPKPRSEAEQNTILRAKEVLMEQHGYSEEEAHRYLQKQSMDQGRSIIETAEMLLKLYI